MAWFTKERKLKARERPDGRPRVDGLWHKCEACGEVSTSVTPRLITDGSPTGDIWFDDISLVGTANMDNRSFRLNFEIAAVLYDRGWAESLAAVFHTDLSRAVSYHLREARRAP